MIEKFSVKSEGTAKLNLRRNAKIRDNMQVNKSMLNIIHEGVVVLKNLIDFTMNEFEL